MARPLDQRYPWGDSRPPSVRKAIDVTSGDNRTDDDTGRNDAAGTESSRETVAVALDYDAERDRAPKVLAGGRGAIAEQILEMAFANGVKVREDADLAELLSSIDLEAEIPTEAFPAVAEILIYVYRANGDWPSFLDEAMGGAAPGREPGPDSGRGPHGSSAP